MAKIGGESRHLQLDICASMIEVLEGPNGESVTKIMDPRTALPSRASQSHPPNQLAESMLHLRQAQSRAEFRNNFWEANYDDARIQSCHEDADGGYR